LIPAIFEGLSRAVFDHRLTGRRRLRFAKVVDSAPCAPPAEGAGADAISTATGPGSAGSAGGRLADSNQDPQLMEQERANMPKLKTHKGMKKRFKVSATGKVSHKRCGSSHLNSHKSGKRVRRLRKSTKLKVTAEARRIRFALLDKQNINPDLVHAEKMAAMAAHATEASHSGPADKKTS
jgi:large subunit ribosomal protein L35